MVLYGEGVNLRTIEKNDTADIILWRNNPEVRKYFINQELITEQGHLNWLKEYVLTGKAEQFIIINNETDHSMGSVYLRDIDKKNRKAEFGIFIGEDEYQGHGYGAQIISLILQYGFNVLDLNKIFLRVLADNIRAIRCYEKAGFHQEGYFKKEVIINSDFRDIIFMAKYKEE